tara:strand:+ start:3047 stop:4075 length:1029 start_codon:yes stop_codon:yes gene_type:complete
MTIYAADIVFGLAWGDEGKGKITSHLGKSYNYNFVCRWAGGPNAGHTVYIDGNKYKTHLIPSGVFHGITSVIGPGCVLNPNKFWQELSYLKDAGFDTSLIKVSPNTHIITQKHISLDKKNLSESLGTTSNGIAYSYADRAARVGIRAKDVLPKEMIWDQQLYGEILCEGAQGVWLDLDWGNYPFVTSSVTLPYGACSLGIPMEKVRDIWGVAKIYDTRSGEDPKFPDTLLLDEDLHELAELGNEYGVTTGRARKVNWLDLNYLVNAIKISGANKIVINKCDIISELGVYKLYWNDNLLNFNSLNEMKTFIIEIISRNNICQDNIYFSGHPEIIEDDANVTNA